MGKVQTNIKLDSQLKSEAIRVAEKYGYTLTEVIEYLLKAWVREEK